MQHKIQIGDEKMKKTILVLLMAIVMLGCVFAETATSTSKDELTLKIPEIKATNETYWSTSPASLTDGVLTVSDIATYDFTDVSSGIDQDFYATLVTNSSTKATLKVSGTNFSDGNSHELATTYTYDETTNTDGSGSVSDSDSNPSGLRLLDIKVNVSVEANEIAKATAGSYTATLTATVSGI